MAATDLHSYTDIRTMVTVAEALHAINTQVNALPAVVKPLAEALQLVLAADVYAPCDIPAYPQSSMDGYAFCYTDWQPGTHLVVQGEMAAGTNRPAFAGAGTAVRIFTGAPVPEGADTVVMQEQVQVSDGQLLITNEALQPAANVRPQGSEIKEGMLALAAGSVLTPAAIGFLAGLGITGVLVYPDPVITVIVTGNELQQPGKPLGYGQVYESNSFALRSALRLMGLVQVTVRQATDDAALLAVELQEALAQSDVVLLTGGVSVGEYDFVLPAAARCGVEPLFHKIRQKPGKPIFFGKKEEKLVFGLPGNPSSVLTCFYRYVAPALGRCCRRNLSLPTLSVPLERGYRKPAGLTHFLKGYYTGQAAAPLDAQESYRLFSFARANCLVEIPAETTECAEGDLVTIHLLPQ